MSTNNICAQLVAVKSCLDITNILINENKFSIGRSIENSLVLPYVNISRHHCIIQYNESSWSLTDISSTGTYVNGFQVHKKNPQKIEHNDEIKLGSLKDAFIFKFTTEIDETPPPPKKMKVDKLTTTNIDNFDVLKESPKKNEQSDMLSNKIQEIVEKYESEKAFLQSELKDKDKVQNEILHQKKQIEDSLKQEIYAKKILIDNENFLSKKLHEMQEKLKEQEKIQQEIIQKLNEKEKQRIYEIEVIKERQEIERQEMFNKLKDELKQREKTIRESLEAEINTLRNEKHKLSTNIKGFEEKCGGMKEELNVLMKQCEQISKDLEASLLKKKLLEEQLTNINSINQKNEQNLYAKENLLEHFEKMMEIELQCSICNELFVKTNILNCSHSFCKFCINEWRKKKNECPICRTTVKTQNKNIVLDNFIDKMVENFSMDMKKKRQDIIEARLAVESTTSKNKTGKQSINNQQRRRTRALSGNSSSRQRIRMQNSNVDAPSTSTGTVAGTYTEDEEYSVLSISIDESLSSDSLVEMSESFVSDESDSYEEEEDESYSTVPAAYYGGYGYCYRCGDENHWANGCPLRYRN